MRNSGSIPLIPTLIIIYIKMKRKNLYKRQLVNRAKKNKKLKFKFKYSLCATTYGTIFYKELESHTPNNFKAIGPTI